jgi:hypothetical protein
VEVKALVCCLDIAASPRDRVSFDNHTPPSEKNEPGNTSQKADGIAVTRPQN